MFDNPIYNYPIDLLLEHLGCKEEGKGMYYSPLRNETTPSLHVNKRDNVWYDHGAGIGGTNVQLIMAVKKCSKEEAESYIKTLDPAAASRTESISKPESAPTTEIIKVKPICSYYLKKYLEERKIPISIADKYCKEVILRNHVKGKDYTTLGFENNAGGYNLSAPYGFKSCSKGGITTIDTEGKRTVMPSTRGVAIFEGSFDFLSWQVLQNSKTPTTDILVLNSVNNLDKATGYLNLHESFICFLDNDFAGRKCLEDIHFFVVDGEHSRTSYFAQDGNLVVGHTNRYNGAFLEVGTQLLADEIFGFALGESADLQAAQHREVDGTLVAHQVLLKGGLSVQ